MSKIGRKPIEIPEGVKVEIDGNLVRVIGQKGNLELDTKGFVNILVDDNLVTLTMKDNIANPLAYWGLYRSLISNMITGVSDGFEKRLELHGVGYRATGGGQKITFNLGYSHPIEFDVPQGIDVAIEDQTKVIIKGIDKTLVGQVAANMKKLRKPEPYKGKGIRYEGEVIRRKAGKTAVG